MVFDEIIRDKWRFCGCNTSPTQRHQYISSIVEKESWWRWEVWGLCAVLISRMRLPAKVCESFACEWHEGFSDQGFGFYGQIYRKTKSFIRTLIMYLKLHEWNEILSNKQKILKFDLFGITCNSRYTQTNTTLMKIFLFRLLFYLSIIKCPNWSPLLIWSRKFNPTANAR